MKTIVLDEEQVAWITRWAERHAEFHRTQLAREGKMSVSLQRKRKHIVANRHAHLTMCKGILDQLT